MPERPPSSRATAGGSSGIESARDPESPDARWSTLTDEPPAPHPVAKPWPARRSWMLASIVAAALALASSPIWLGPAQTWLAAHDQYLLEFHSITLDPSPPACFRPGQQALLERVRLASGLPQRFSPLDTPLEYIARGFALGSPWIKEVQALESQSFPTRLTVRLVYRSPVAYLAGPHGARVVLDEHAVVLPNDDLDLSQTSELIQISGWNGPIAGRVGLMLPTNNAELEHALLAACRLARFILDKSDQSGKSNQPPPRSKERTPRVTLVDLRHGYRRLLIRTDLRVWAFWGPGPTDEADGELPAEVKWSQLADWTRHTDARDQDFEGKVLVFGPRGADLRPAPGGLEGDSRTPTVNDD